MVLDVEEPDEADAIDFLSVEARRDVLAGSVAGFGGGRLMSRTDVPAGEVRALTILDAIPAGCRAMPVLDDSNAPHLRQGEVAVIDPADCDLIHGELFAVAYGRGPDIVQAVWRTTGNLSAWWAMCLNRPRGPGGFDAWARAGRTIPMADGPYRDGGLESITLGRVVGILQPATEQVSHG